MQCFRLIGIPTMSITLLKVESFCVKVTVLNQVAISVHSFNMNCHHMVLSCKKKAEGHLIVRIYTRYCLMGGVYNREEC